MGAMGNANVTGEILGHRSARLRNRSARAVVAVVVFAGLLVALALDLVLAPDLPVAWVYAVPVLLASYAFEPRIVGLTAGAAVATFVIGVWLQQMWSVISLYFGFGLLLITGLTTRLAYHRSVAIRRAARAEAAEGEAQQARAEAEAARDAVRQQVSRLRALADASRAFASELDLTPLLDVITREAGRSLGDGSVLYLLEDRHLIPSAVYHLDAERVTFMRQLFAESPLQLDEGIGGRVVQTGQPVRLPVISPQEHRLMLRPEHWSVAERLWVHSALGVPLRMRDSVLGVIVLWRDTPERPYTEDDEVFLQEFADRAAMAVERARLYEIERQAVRARNEFISVAAHELRTPITALRGYAQRAQRHLARSGMTANNEVPANNGVPVTTGAKSTNGAAPSSLAASIPQKGGRLTTALDVPQLQQALHVIVEQSDRLNGMIRELLDASRIDAGKLVLNRQSVDLVSLVKRVASQSQDTSKPERVIVRAPETLVIHVDPLRIEQVLVNLLINAIKFSPDGGPIEIEVGPCAASGRSTEPLRAVSLSVRDHGVGIPTERRPRLFERFYQAHEEGRAGGMGLGLYISKQIVEAHGGSIVAEFPADGGTCFIISLPVCPPTEQPAAVIDDAGDTHGTGDAER